MADQTIIDDLNEDLKTYRQSFRDYATERLMPHASEWDRAGRIPPELIRALGAEGYLCGIIPKTYGGAGWNCQTMGVQHEAFGRVSSSLTVLLTVSAMVASTIVKWGSGDQRKEWLGKIASGECIAAYALTEPQAGSDLAKIECRLERRGGDLVLTGTKKWITFATEADLFLVFAVLEGQPTAVLVPRTLPGVSVHPVEDMLGFRAAGIGEVQFEGVALPESNVVGRVGFGFSMVAPYGLHHGRMSTAFSSLGLVRACLETASQYASEREVAGGLLAEKGIVKSLMARMGVQYDAAWELCMAGARAEDAGSYEAYQKILAAKHFASTTANSAAHDMGQVLGAAGMQGSRPAERYFRDARIMEIIEGSTQVLELLLGKIYIDKFRKSRYF